METPVKESSDSPPKASLYIGSTLFCGFCGFVLIAQLIRYSPLKPLWLDEIYTFYQVDGKSTAETLSSLGTGFNLIPPLYFLFLSWALHFAHFTPLLGRALSCGFIAATVPVMWRVLRRHVGGTFTAAAIGGVIFSAPLISFHNTEARPYGLYLFCASLILLGFVLSAENVRCSKLTLIFIAVANALLPSSIYFGGLYSALTFAVILYFDWRSGHPRYRVYGAYFAGWLLYAAVILPFAFGQYHARGNNGTQWLPLPAASLLLFYQQSLRTLLPFCALVPPFLLWCIFRRQRRPKIAVGQASISPPGPSTVSVPAQLATLGVLWLGVPVFFILQAWLTGKNLFFGRYFIASDLGWILVVAVAASYACRRLVGTRTFEEAEIIRWARSAAQLLVGAFVAFLGWHFYRTNYVPASVYAGDVATVSRWNVPKATFSIGFFLEGHYHSQPEIDYIYLSRNERDLKEARGFHSSFRAWSPDNLIQLPEFLFIDSSDTPKNFDVISWAQAHGYTAEHVGDYKQLKRTTYGVFLLHARSFKT